MHHLVFQTRRFDRCMIRPNISSNSVTNKQYSNARSYLRLLTESIICGKQTHDASVDNLKSYLPSEITNSFELMISSTNDITKKLYAKVFKLFSYDSSVDAIIPYATLDLIDSFLSSALSTDEFYLKMRYFNVDFADLVKHTCQNNIPQDMFEMMQYLVTFLKKINENAVLPDDSLPINESYNPAKLGRAYYFTPHGNQVREIRKFEIDTNSKENFDDTPELLCS